MPERWQHSQEVQDFLQQSFACQPWELTLPGGSGHETYIARCRGQACFVKLGVQIPRYQAAGSIGLAPRVLAAGFLADGTSLVVQTLVAGRTPTPGDYSANLEKFASAINRLHHSEEVRRVLSGVPSTFHRDAGLDALARLQRKWERYRPLVPGVARFVDEGLQHLGRQVMDFQGAGLVASHNDICNANWLIDPLGGLHLLDLEAMSLDDPALDLGATIWWYYPPHLRQRFLALSGCGDDPDLKRRMQVRMAMHCLDITLPRDASFDRFDPASFAGSLVDFRAVLAGRENPQGYGE